MAQRVKEEERRLRREPTSASATTASGWAPRRSLSFYFCFPPLNGPERAAVVRRCLQADVWGWQTESDVELAAI